MFQDSAKTSPRRKDGEELSKDSVVDPEYLSPDLGFLLKSGLIHILGLKQQYRSPTAFQREHTALLNLKFLHFSFISWAIFSFSGHHNTAKTYMFSSFFLWANFPARATTTLQKHTF
jgi:hypothetical protein